MEKKTINLIRILFIFFSIIGLIIFIINGERNDKLADIRFNVLEINGIITDIKYFENKRGFPDYLINDKWIYLGLNGEKIQNHVIINDSLCKNSGSDTINIYRKNENDEWVLIKAR
jgi:hypothetical protein